MVTSDFSPEVETRPFRACAMKKYALTLIYGRIAQIFASFRKSGPRNTMVTSDFLPEVEIRPFRACAMHPAIIIGTIHSLWTWLWDRYHVPQNAFLVLQIKLCPTTVQIFSLSPLSLIDMDSLLQCLLRAWRGDISQAGCVGSGRNSIIVINVSKKLQFHFARLARTDENK